jgi:uncharacterized membrane protein YqjE
MTEDPAADHGTENEAPPSHGYAGVFRGLFGTVIEAARTRLDLAAVEAEIFLLLSLRMLLWALAALACGLLALAFAVVAVVAALWDTHRMLGVLSGAGLFVVLAAVFSYIASRTFKGRPSMLEGTLQQLETDQHRTSGKP